MEAKRHQLHAQVRASVGVAVFAFVHVGEMPKKPKIS